MSGDPGATAPPAGGPQAGGPAPQSAGGKEEIGSLVRSIQEDVRRRAALESAPLPGQGHPRLTAIVLAVVVALNAYLWIGRPDWLIPGGPPDPVEVLRFQMYIQAQRIEAHRRENGTPPDRLEPLGGPVGELLYRRLEPAGWELRGRVRGVDLVLASGDDLDRFLAGTPPSSQE